MIHMVQLKIRQQKGDPISFDGMTLKAGGWIFTLCGFLAAVLYDGNSLDWFRAVMTFISYMALPIFALLTLEGVRHTSNFGKYFLTTVIFAVITEPFYDFAQFRDWLRVFDENAQNFLFTVALCQIMLYYLMAVKPGKNTWLIKGVIILATLVWGMMSRSQYAGFTIITTLILYFTWEKKWLTNILVTVFSIFTLFTPCASLLLTHRYNGTRGTGNKYFFYGLYPAMWIVACIVKLFI